MKSICIDAWNQAGLNEVSMTCRSAATGHERNDADIKMAIIRTSGFKGGQSKANTGKAGQGQAAILNNTTKEPRT